MSTAFDLGCPEVCPTPFPWFLVPGALAAARVLTLHAWLVDHPRWRTVTQPGYALDEMRLLPERLPDDLTWVASTATIDRLRTTMGCAFGAALGQRVDVDVHRLRPGQAIGIHNDARPDEETHRLVVGLNPVWDDDDGQLLLFAGPRLDDVEVAVPPLGGCAVGFAIGDRSFHAVIEPRRARLSLVYSFYGPGR